VNSGILGSATFCFAVSAVNGGGGQVSIRSSLVRFVYRFDVSTEVGTVTPGELEAAYRQVPSSNTQGNVLLEWDKPARRWTCWDFGTTEAA
jgi:hypothetical protein